MRTLLEALLSVSISSTSAYAGGLRFVNCSKSKIRAQTFNSDDLIKYVAIDDKCLRPGKAATLKCKTEKCSALVFRSCRGIPGVFDIKPTRSGSTATYYNGDLLIYPPGALIRTPAETCKKIKN